MNKLSNQTQVSWQIAQLNDTCTLINGRAYKKKELLAKGKYPVLRVGNFFSNKSWYYSDLELPANKYCDNGDLLYAWSASFGPRIWQGEKVIYHYHIWKVKIDPSKITKKFLYYWFDWDKEKIKAEQGAGTTMIHVTKGSMENRLFPYPSLPEQKRIVAILNEAFAGIDQAIANTEKNLANAREVFESYLNGVFTRKGAGWETKIFGELCSFVRGPFGGSLKKSCFVDDGYAVYEQQHAINNQFHKIRYFVDKDKFTEMSRFELRPGDLIMSCSGTMGKIAIVPENIKRGIINQALLKLSPRQGLQAEFLKYWMESITFQEQISLHSKGAAIKNVASVKVLKQIKVPAPKITIQKGIVDNLDNFLEETRLLESIYQKKLTALAELKQSILQKAFTGELTEAC